MECVVPVRSSVHVPAASGARWRLQSPCRSVRDIRRILSHEDTRDQTKRVAGMPRGLSAQLTGGKSHPSLFEAEREGDVINFVSL